MKDLESVLFENLRKNNNSFVCKKANEFDENLCFQVIDENNLKYVYLVNVGDSKKESFSLMDSIHRNNSSSHIDDILQIVGVYNNNTDKFYVSKKVPFRFHLEDKYKDPIPNFTGYKGEKLPDNLEFDFERILINKVFDYISLLYKENKFKLLEKYNYVSDAEFHGISETAIRSFLDNEKETHYFKDNLRLMINSQSNITGTDYLNYVNCEDAYIKQKAESLLKEKLLENLDKEMIFNEQLNHIYQNKDHKFDRLYIAKDIYLPLQDKKAVNVYFDESILVDGAKQPIKFNAEKLQNRILRNIDDLKKKDKKINISGALQRYSDEDLFIYNDRRCHINLFDIKQITYGKKVLFEQKEKKEKSLVINDTKEKKQGKTIEFKESSNKDFSPFSAKDESKNADMHLKI